MKKNLISLIQVLKELSYILDNKQKRDAVIVLIATLLNSVCELLGIAIILPFIEMVQDPRLVLNNSKYAPFINLLGIASEKKLLLIIGFTIVLIYVIKGLYSVIFIWIQSDYSTNFSYTMATRTLKSYLKHPYEYFLQTNSSDILRGCGSDVEHVSNMITCIMNIMSSIITILILTIYLFYTDFIITFSMLMLIGALMVLMIVYFKPMMKEVGQLDANLTLRKNKALLQIVGGIKEIFVAKNQAFFYEQYDNAYDISRKTTRKYTFYNGIPSRLIEVVCASGIIIVLCFKILQGTVDDSFLPKLAIFAVSIFKMFPLCALIINRINTMVYSRPRLKNLYEIKKEAEIYNESKFCLTDNIKNIFFNKSSLKRNIVVDNISWKYEGSDRFILKNFSIEIKKGESVAFIGESGAGKTTLVDTIMGLFKPLTGCIYVDDDDIFENPYKWANMISYVPQTVYLLDDTIRENILFGCKKENDYEDRVWQCLEEASLADYVKTLPDGLNTIVGERGVRLSGGQRQRIAIARALFKRPDVLVLDEATSALDNETESAIMESIDFLKGKITILLIAHRLSTVRNCDRIIEIKDGNGRDVEKKELFG